MLLIALYGPYAPHELAAVGFDEVDLIWRVRTLSQQIGKMVPDVFVMPGGRVNALQHQYGSCTQQLAVVKLRKLLGEYLGQGGFERILDVFRSTKPHS